MSGSGRTRLDVEDHLERLLVEGHKRVEAGQVEVVFDEVLGDLSEVCRREMRRVTASLHSWPGKEQNQLIHVNDSVPLAVVSSDSVDESAPVRAHSCRQAELARQQSMRPN